VLSHLNELRARVPGQGGLTPLKQRPPQQEETVSPDRPPEQREVVQRHAGCPHVEDDGAESLTELRIEEASASRLGSTYEGVHVAA
jgi:hypothetical protein